MVRFVDYPEKEKDIYLGQPTLPYCKYYFVKHCFNPYTKNHLNSLRLKFLTIRDAMEVRELLKDFKGVNIRYLKKIKSPLKKYEVYIKLTNDDSHHLIFLEQYFAFWIDIGEILDNYPKNKVVDVFSSLIQKLNSRLDYYQPLKCHPDVSKNTGPLVSLIKNSKEFLKRPPKLMLESYGLL